MLRSLRHYWQTEAQGHGCCSIKMSGARGERCRKMFYLIIYVYFDWFWVLVARRKYSWKLVISQANIETVSKANLGNFLGEEVTFPMDLDSIYWIQQNSHGPISLLHHYCQDKERWSQGLRSDEHSLPDQYIDSHVDGTIKYGGPNCSDCRMKVSFLLLWPWWKKPVSVAARGVADEVRSKSYS